MDFSSSLIGNKIKFLRNKYSLSQEEFAKKTDLKKNTVYRLESDRSKPTLETVLKICLAFGISSDFMLSLDDKNLITSDELYQEYLTQDFIIVEGLSKQQINNLKQTADFMRNNVKH